MKLDMPVKEEQTKILVIIVTYNAMPWADRCLESLRDSTIKPDVFIVDNGSTDGTQEYIKQRYSHVVFYQSNKNIGFGKANNIGLKYAVNNNYDYVYLLNQDAWIMPNTIGSLVDFSKRHPEYAILSPFQMEADMKHIDKNFIKGVCSWNSCPTIFNDLYNNELDDVYPVTNVMAAHWFMTRTCLETIGCFSPSFPHYGEDDNYADRVYFWKLKIGIIPSLKVVHDRAGRLDSPAKVLYLNYVKCLRMLSEPFATHRGRSLLNFFAYSIKFMIVNKSLSPFVFWYKIFSCLPSLNRNRRISMNVKGAFFV